MSISIPAVVFLLLWLAFVALIAYLGHEAENTSPARRAYTIIVLIVDVFIFIYGQYGTWFFMTLAGLGISLIVDADRWRKYGLLTSLVGILVSIALDLSAFSFFQYLR